MNIVVVSALVPGQQWAHIINTVKTADGFCESGHNVTIITRHANNKIDYGELCSLYGVSDRIKWVHVGGENKFWETKTGLFLFAYLALRRVREIDPDFCYSRNYVFPWLCAKSGINIVAESHAEPGTGHLLFRTLVKATAYSAFKAWVTISENLKTYYESLGVPTEKIFILPDAVDLSLFEQPENLPESPYQSLRKNVVYAGHLYDYKGIPTILETAELMTELQFQLVGGWPEDVERYRKLINEKNITNIKLHGMVPHAEVPVYLWHADVLLLPPSAEHPSANWTSPVKLGEYLASGVPVVSTNIPALRVWLTEDETLFVDPDDAQSMEHGIREIFANPERSSAMAVEGKLKANRMSYKQKAEKIISMVYAN